MSYVVELAAVSKSYPPPTPVEALVDVSLRIGTGETVAITGPSGSGKSTLLNILGTLEAPTSGQVTIDGIDASSLGDDSLSALRANRIGFVFQQFHLLRHLSILDNVATGLLYRGGSTKERRAAARDALDRVGLAGRSGHRPAQLSGGEQQRAAIARAIVGSPSIVLADEPTGNLDSVSGDLVMELLRGLAGLHTTVVVITHDALVASAMHRRVALRDGRIVDDSAAA
ncbi:ABC transporter ATP-binding protein [Diaminobutyricibacter tongyongensis]|uniref:ABC transporter ATP-binding protein n=1 Tax=Leifsonia tongyongensis TaxID=1268043 RepID=A0A6L9Y029_9MICO|nr:ABC transporter ATP-binding protein [Diaminobutyricibacter tongyongensis]NEN06634.1 ABC transporter ATP-binding protein [Diaminobutyricibacter tongyongensis]